MTSLDMCDVIQLLCVSSANDLLTLSNISSFRGYHHYNWNIEQKSTAISFRERSQIASGIEWVRKEVVSFKVSKMSRVVALLMCVKILSFVAGKCSAKHWSDFWNYLYCSKHYWETTFEIRKRSGLGMNFNVMLLIRNWQGSVAKVFV